MNDFARVKEIMRVEGRFDFGHDVQKIFAELFAHEFGARHAHAMFARQRAFELQNQRGYLVRELAEFLKVLFRECRSSTGRTCSRPAAAWP